MGKIAVLHTTPATVAPLNAMIREACPGVEIENFVDDSILPMINRDENTLSYAYEKLLTYAEYAQKQNAQLILNACSSVGEFKPFAQDKLSVPLVRIDDPVTDIIAERGGKIYVLATLPSTLRPSCELIQSKIEGKNAATVTPVLVDGAYQALVSGDKSEHDRLIAEAALSCRDGDTIFLAQASMADAAKQLPASEQNKIFFSTKWAIDAVAELYRSLNK